MKAAVLKAYGNLEEIHVEEVPVPTPGPNEVLIEMKCAPINVSDLAFFGGGYLTKDLPAPLGNEGSGVIVGGDESLIGKRVAVAPGGGTYGQYVVANKYIIFPLNDDVTFEQGASMVVNPMTVAYMMEKIKVENHRAVVLNAAASALGRMLIRWCAKEGIPTVCLVRRPEQVEILRAIGAQHIFNTSEENWMDEARRVSTELGVSCGFDAIAGDETGQIMRLVAKRGIVYNYGGLSGKNPVIPILEAMIKEKRFQGLYLTGWTSEFTPQKKEEVSQSIQSMLGDILKTDYGQEYPLDNIREAYRNYIGKKTDAKPLIRMN